MLGFRSKHEARVVSVVGVAIVIVVIDPHRQPVAKTLDERKGGLFVARAPCVGCKRDVEDDDSSRQAPRLRKLARSPIRQMRKTTHISNM